MKVKALLFAALMGLGIWACNTDGDQADVTESGFPFEIYASGDATKASTGDWIFFHIAQRVGEQVLTDTRGNPNPTPSYRVTGKEEEVEGGMDPIIEVIRLMSPGDSASISIPFDSLPPMAAQQFPEDSVLYFDLEVTEIKTDDEVTGGAATRLEAINQQFQDGTLEGLQYTEDSLGYYIISEGAGEIPLDTAVVSVDYYGIFQNGQMFDNSLTKGRPFEFQLGQGGVIQGWDKGIPLLKEGSEAVLFVPYELGYGEMGGRGIPPASDLIFYVKLLEIKE